MTYNPETYWTRVGQEIEKRSSGTFVAGDDNPYYRYKRVKFLRRFLDQIDFTDRTILEIGPGPGGNLKHIATHHRSKLLVGADISQKMCDLSARNLTDFANVQLYKTTGTDLPLADQSIDLSFTVTVLQHVTDGAMVSALIRNICRVTKSVIVIMENIGWHQELSGCDSYTGRTIQVYRDAFAAHGFQMQNVQFLNTKVSRRWFERSWKIYTRLFPKGRHEGDRINAFGRLLIGGPLPGTRLLDELHPETTDLGKLTFVRAA
jgi:hypothetical protein